MVKQDLRENNRHVSSVARLHSLKMEVGEEDMEEIQAEEEPTAPLRNQDPHVVANIYYSFTGALATYGWYILFGIVALVFIKIKLDPYIEKWRKKRQQQESYNFDAATTLKRQEAMDAARRKLQDRYDSEAEQFAEEQRQKDELKRQMKLEDWERHRQGKGYRSKVYKPKEEEKPSASGSSQPKPKSRFKPDYNPLMGGGGGGAGYRPARRGGGG